MTARLPVSRGLTAALAVAGVSALAWACAVLYVIADWTLG
ncbi:morphogenic membrane protein MmpA [Streptomyces litmocidini]|uniref:Morphogenic membrane protein MmpA n=1 Tax=Streptomyces litmocidini TaxID=67318 RepID=A0ABW7UCD5_9ACTN